MDKPSNVVQLVTQVGEGYTCDADEVLEGAKGKLRQALVIGWEKDQTFYIATSSGDAENLLLLEIARRTLLDGYFADED